MKSFIKLALAATLAVMASLCGSAKMTLTYQQAVQLVKAHRTSQNLDNDSVNFYAAQTDTIINDYCCPISGPIPTPWINNTYSKILVFVNEKPLDRWNHDCSYYYLPMIVNDLKNVPIIKYQGIMPPNGVIIAPIDINLVPSIRAAIPQNLNINPSLLPSLTSPNISNPSLTQVLIMAAPINDPYDFTYRWNDCASLYCVLTQVYSIPKQNIHLFLGDSSSYNYMIDTYGNEIPMLRDLDGDEIDENIQPFDYGTLDDFRDEVADSLALAGVNHLFTFYTGALWAYDPYDSMGSYTPMMSEDLDVMDFEATIYRVQADYNTALCCCKDANYVTSIFSHPGNYILIAANYYGYYANHTVNNGDPQIYFKPWLAAMAGQDLESGNFVDADYNNDGYISMAEANTYAESIEVGNTSFMTSTPSSAAANVSFGHIELYDGLHVTIDGWASPDIWVRNQNDGIIEQEQDILTYDTSNPYKYVYVKVTNQSTEDYDGSGIYLQLYWKKPILGISNSTLYNSNGFWDKRGYITTIPLNQRIASGQDTILSYQWSLPTELITFAQANSNVLPVVVMAELTRSVVPIPPKNVTATNGLLRLDVQSGPTVQYINPDQMANVRVYNVNRIPVYYYPSPGSIGLDSISQSGNNRVYSRDSLSIELSPGVASNATTSTNITPVGLNPTTFEVNGTGRIDGLVESYSLDSMVINIKSDALKVYMSPSSDKIGFNIYKSSEIAQSLSNGSIPTPYGTMPVEFIAGANNNFGPPIIRSTGNDDHSIDLSATQVSANSICSWYGRDGLMGTGNSLHLDADEARGVVQLIAIDEENSYVGQAFTDLDELVSVSRIGFINNGNVVVELTKPANQNLAVQAVSTLTGNVVATGQLAAGNDSMQLTASGWASGTYLVSVIKGGTIVQTVQLVKQ